jgi:hypothetical protein
MQILFCCQLLDSQAPLFTESLSITNWLSLWGLAASAL